MIMLSTVYGGKLYYLMAVAISCPQLHRFQEASHKPHKAIQVDTKGTPSSVQHKTPLFGVIPTTSHATNTQERGYCICCPFPHDNNPSFICQNTKNNHNSTLSTLLRKANSLCLEQFTGFCTSSQCQYLCNCRARKNFTPPLHAF